MSLALHASAFAYRGVGCLLLGESGAGKSALVGQALLFGAVLIADDHLQLRVRDGALIAHAPPETAGMLELRGLGVIHTAATVAQHRLDLAIELVDGEGERLPAPETRDFLGVSLPFLRLPAAPKTPVASLLLYCQAMQEGRILPQDVCLKRIL